jgi:signal transduction histidine kinase
MNDDIVLPEVTLPASSADLETILAAWHDATLRLEQTHEALRAEVCRLTDELEVKNRELARKNRLADLGQMASHIAHEVRNNLVPLTLYLSLLRRRIQDDPGSIEVLDKIEAGFSELDVTVNDLLHFTQDRDPQCQSFALRRLVEDVVGSLAPQCSAQKITTFVEMGENLMVTADRNMLRRALLNLVLNALDAMPNGGTLTVRATYGERGVEIKVADTGTGLSEEASGRAFEPFFTTKPGGTGLGLAIVHRIAEVHGGSVSGTNGPGGGAVFGLAIPYPAQEAAA